jgi:hypothetical protein
MAHMADDDVRLLLHVRLLHVWLLHMWLLHVLLLHMLLRTSIHAQADGLSAEHRARRFNRRWPRYAMLCVLRKASSTQQQRQEEGLSATQDEKQAMAALSNAVCTLDSRQTSTEQRLVSRRSSKDKRRRNNRDRILQRFPPIYCNPTAWAACILHYVYSGYSPLASKSSSRMIHIFELLTCFPLRRSCGSPLTKIASSDCSVVEIISPKLCSSQKHVFFLHVCVAVLPPPSFAVSIALIFPTMSTQFISDLPFDALQSRQTTSFDEFLNRGRHSASGKWALQSISMTELSLL